MLTRLVEDVEQVDEEGTMEEGVVAVEAVEVVVTIYAKPGTIAKSSH